MTEIDREKVIHSLECCPKFKETQWQGCAFCDYFSQGCNALQKDILALLKEQEPIAPSVCGSKEPDEHGVCCWRYLCGKCKKPIDHKDRFCKRCGKAVKWDA